MSNGLSLRGDTRPRLRHMTELGRRTRLHAQVERPERRVRATGHNARVALTDPPPRLYGRARETRVLEDLLTSATEHGAALVLLGEPGIGKSALVPSAGARARASGFPILTATGIQSEAELPFAGLHQLTRALHAGVDALPSPQREAMLAAFGR